MTNDDRRRKLHDDLEHLPDEHLPTLQQYLEKLTDSRQDPPPQVPPRLLAPQRSYWLRPGETVTLVRDKLHAYHRDGACILVSAPQMTERVQVNGVRLRGAEYRLQAGDFIRLDGDRFIFQADPVAAKQARGPIQLPAYLSEKTRARVVINAEGLGISKNHPTYTLWSNNKKPALRALADRVIRWDEIACLHISNTRYSTHASIRPVGALAQAIHPRLPGWVHVYFPLLSFHFNRGEIHTFLDWLRTAAPVDLSVHGSYHYRRLLPDAYLAATDALIDAHRPGTLPAPEDFIRGKPTRRQMLPSLGLVVGALLMGVVLCGLTTGVRGGPAGFFILLGLMASGFMVLFGLIHLDHLSSYWRESGLMEAIAKRMTGHDRE